MATTKKNRAIQAARATFRSLVTTEPLNLKFTWWTDGKEELAVIDEALGHVTIIRRSEWGETAMMSKTYLLENFQQITKDGVIPLRKTKENHKNITTCQKPFISGESSRRSPQKKAKPPKTLPVRL